MSNVVMLNEVEQMINSHLELFNEFDDFDPVLFKDMKKKIRRQELADNQEEKKIQKQLDLENYKKMKKEQDEMRKGKAFGKP